MNLNFVKMHFNKNSIHTLSYKSCSDHHKLASAQVQERLGLMSPKYDRLAINWANCITSPPQDQNLYLCKVCVLTAWASTWVMGAETFIFMSVSSNLRNCMAFKSIWLSTKIAIRFLREYTSVFSISPELHFYRYTLPSSEATFTMYSI